MTEYPRYIGVFKPLNNIYNTFLDEFIKKRNGKVGLKFNYKSWIDITFYLNNINNTKIPYNTFRFSYDWADNTSYQTDADLLINLFKERITL